VKVHARQRHGGAGIVLSQPTRRRLRRRVGPRQTSSIESAITSRADQRGFIPSVPMVLGASLMANVFELLACRPRVADGLPSLADRRRRWESLQGMVRSRWFATPMRGLRRSVGRKPNRLEQARAGAGGRARAVDTAAAAMLEILGVEDYTWSVKENQGLSRVLTPRRFSDSLPWIMSAMAGFGSSIDKQINWTMKYQRCKTTG